MVLLQAGDVETNPGPENLYDLSVLHLNIRGRNKTRDKRPGPGTKIWNQILSAENGY